MASSSATTYTVIAHYSDTSGFLNALTPTCTVRTVNGTVVASGTMTLIADGDYKLTFSGLTNTQYLWQSDAGSSLPHSIRFLGIRQGKRNKLGRDTGCASGRPYAWACSSSGFDRQPTAAIIIVSRSDLKEISDR